MTETTLFNHDHSQPLFVDSPFAEPFDTLLYMRAAKKLDEVKGKTIKVADFIWGGTMVTDQNGEAKDAKRTILVCSDGSAFASVSTGIYSSSREIVEVMGRRRFDPPIKLEVREVSLTGGKHTYNLVPVR